MGTISQFDMKKWDKTKTTLEEMNALINWSMDRCYNGSLIAQYGREVTRDSKKLKNPFCVKWNNMYSW
jgi:hypothetical protein